MSLLKKSWHCARDCYKKKNDLKKKESHTKLANSDENSIDKPDKIALKSSSQIKDADWWIDSGASQHMPPEKKSLLKTLLETASSMLHHASSMLHHAQKLL